MTCKRGSVQVGDSLEEFLLGATEDAKLRQLMMSMSEAIRTIAFKVRNIAVALSCNCINSGSARADRFTRDQHGNIPLVVMILHYQILNPNGILAKPDDCNGHAGWANTCMQAKAVCSAALLQPTSGLSASFSWSSEQQHTLPPHIHVVLLDCLSKLLAQAFLCGTSQRHMKVCIVAHSIQMCSYSQIQTFRSKCMVS